MLLIVKIKDKLFNRRNEVEVESVKGELPLQDINPDNVFVNDELEFTNEQTDFGENAKERIRQIAGGSGGELIQNHTVTGVELVGDFEPEEVYGFGISYLNKDGEEITTDIEFNGTGEIVSDIPDDIAFIKSIFHSFTTIVCNAKNLSVDNGKLNFAPFVSGDLEEVGVLPLSDIRFVCYF